MSTTILSSLFLPFIHLLTPNLYELFLLICLGAGGNLIQFCLFRAFAATDASALMPFRYVEFVFAAAFGFIFFGQIPTWAVLGGAILIIFSTSFITYVETRREKKSTKAA